MFKKIFKSKIFTVFIILLIIWIGLSILRISNQSKEVDARVSDLETKAGEIEKSNEYMEKLLTYIKMPEFLEREARIRLNYMLADEKMVSVYKDTNVKSASSLKSQEETSSGNIFTRFWQWLTGK